MSPDETRRFAAAVEVSDRVDDEITEESVDEKREDMVRRVMKEVRERPGRPVSVTFLYRDFDVDDVGDDGPGTRYVFEARIDEVGEPRDEDELSSDTTVL